MEDVAVYGYITPLKVKIVLALALSDAVVKDVEVIMVRSVYSIIRGSTYQSHRSSKPCTWRTTPPSQTPS